MKIPKALKAAFNMEKTSEAARIVSARRPHSCNAKDTYDVDEDSMLLAFSAE